MRPLHEYEEVDRFLRWGMNDCQVSRLTGVPRGTIRDWRHKGRPGLRWTEAGLASDCPLCENGDLPGESYSYLLGIYLGDGYITLMPKAVYKLRIFQDQRYTGILEEIAQAMADVRPSGSMRIGRVQKIGCIELTAHWKHWPCLFPQHGPGRKHERPIQLEGWQREIVVRHPGRFLRGLIHSDGYRGPNWVKGKAYPRYQFTNASDDIRELFCWACDLLGVNWRRMNARSISVARAPDVAKLDSVIGPKT